VVPGHQSSNGVYKVRPDDAAIGAVKGYGVTIGVRGRSARRGGELKAAGGVEGSGVDSRGGVQVAFGGWRGQGISTTTRRGEKSETQHCDDRLKHYNAFGM
jgi:hypothetical protein